jgi:hypothetical protein
MKGTKYKAGGGAMKGTKYRAGGGAMKGTKGMTKGGAMKGAKYMSMGGAARAEMQANPGMSNMPKSVMSALMGDGTRTQGQTPMLKQAKRMKLGGSVVGTKGKAKGGRGLYGK